MKPTVLGLLIALAGLPAFGEEPTLRLGDRQPQAVADPSAAAFARLDAPVAAIAAAADPLGEALRTGFRVQDAKVQLAVVAAPAATAVTSMMSATCTGLRRSIAVPSPNWEYAL